MKRVILIAAVLNLFCFACKNKDSEPDATGTFQATETIISAETAGKILAFSAEQGQELMPGQNVGFIDSTQIYLSTKQVEQNIKAMLRGRPDIQVQVEALKRELSGAESDASRIENLVKAEAASQKMLDDARSRVSVIRSKIDAMQSSLGTSSGTINEQAEALQVQLASLKDQLKKCRIINPLKGMVLETYARAFEMTAPGKPLYRIADLSQLELKAYITQDQISSLKLGQDLKVLVDNGKDDYKSYTGKLTWINDNAEFTPKTIQTKNERANLVYAVKVLVKNDGYLKIGMYGELKFM